MKYKRTQKELELTINKYYQDAIAPKNESGYFIVSQEAFFKNLYESTWEIATHILISSFNINNDIDSDDITTSMINLNMLYDRFEIVNAKKNRVKSKIKESIESLIAKGILEVIYRDDNEQDSDVRLFKVQQSSFKIDEGSNRSKMYFTLQYDSIESILYSENSDLIKANLLSMYAVIATQINHFDYAKAYDNEPTYTSLLHMLNALSVASATKLADKACVTRNTAEKYLDILDELKVIARIKVHRQNAEAFSWQYYYSKYHQRAILRDFVSTLLLQTQFPDNRKSDLTDYSWLNIDDVWDDEIEARAKTSSNITPKTSKQSDGQTPTIVNEASYVIGMSDKEVLDDDLAIENEVDDKDVASESDSGSFFDMFEEDEKEVEQIPKEEVKKPYCRPTDPDELFSDDVEDKRPSIIVKSLASVR